MLLATSRCVNPDLPGLVAIHVQIDRRRIHFLADMNVDGSDAGYLRGGRQILRELKIGVLIGTAGNLHVNRGRNAEIQNLVRNVGGLEEEDFVRKALRGKHGAAVPARSPRVPSRCFPGFSETRNVAVGCCQWSPNR